MGEGGGSGITSINGDVTAAQIIQGTSNVITVNSITGTTTVDISSVYVGQSSIDTLGTITTGVWTGTAINYADLNLIGNVVNADINAAAAISLTKLAALSASTAVETNGSGFLVSIRTFLCVIVPHPN